MAKRFIVMSDEDLELKSQKSKNENTVKAERKAHKAFTNFLIVMGVQEENCDYWHFTEPELDGYLSKFWFGVHKAPAEDSQDDDPELKQQLYKANSLRNFRYGLNRILKTKGHLYDITSKSTTSFQKSQQAFTDVIKELKSEGKGDVKSYPEIEEKGKCFPLISDSGLLT